MSHCQKTVLCIKGCLEEIGIFYQADDENLCELQCVGIKAVSKILHSLKVNEAVGLDEIPARLVKDAEVELAPSLIYLIN